MHNYAQAGPVAVALGLAFSSSLRSGARELQEAPPRFALLVSSPPRLSVRLDLAGEHLSSTVNRMLPCSVAAAMSRSSLWRSSLPLQLLFRSSLLLSTEARFESIAPKISSNWWPSARHCSSSIALKNLVNSRSAVLFGIRFFIRTLTQVQLLQRSLRRHGCSFLGEDRHMSDARQTGKSGRPCRPSSIHDCHRPPRFMMLPV